MSILVPGGAGRGVCDAIGGAGPGSQARDPRGMNAAARAAARGRGPLRVGGLIRRVAPPKLSRIALGGMGCGRAGAPAATEVAGFG